MRGGALPQAPNFPNLTRGCRREQSPPTPCFTRPYRLGAGDTVYLALPTAVDPITCASVNTKTAQERTARDDGMISMPVVGSVIARDMTVKDA
jgi:protein involved in polysaccharide export with SLBB domain